MWVVHIFISWTEKIDISQTGHTLIRQLCNGTGHDWLLIMKFISSFFSVVSVRKIPKLAYIVFHGKKISGFVVILMSNVHVNYLVCFKDQLIILFRVSYLDEILSRTTCNDLSQYRPFLLALQICMKFCL